MLTFTPASSSNVAQLTLDNRGWLEVELRVDDGDLSYRGPVVEAASRNRLSAAALTVGQLLVFTGIRSKEALDGALGLLVQYPERSEPGLTPLLSFAHSVDAASVLGSGLVLERAGVSW